jgi:hypothetical protein
MFVAVVLTDSQMSGFSAIKIKQLSNRWVAPHVGAWIETYSFNWISQRAMSRPAWARGLKLASKRAYQPTMVAPHVGAWIETEENPNAGP